MSEDREVLALLDRAVGQAPPLQLGRAEVVARGEQIVRRRRAGIFGMAAATVALVGVLWVSVAGEGGMLGTQQITPAGVSWDVEQTVTVTVVDGVTQGGGVAPLTITKTPTGASATFEVNGEEETVAGRSLAGGADVFVGEAATVMVWATPSDAEGFLVLPETHAGYQSGPFEAAGEDLTYWFTETSGYEPDEILLYGRGQVWSASGAVAETAELAAGPVRQTAFALPGLEIVGALRPDRWVAEPGSVSGSGGSEPWWRGGGDYEHVTVRMPGQAVFARMVWDDLSGDVVLGEQKPTVRVGDAAFALFVFDHEPADIDRSRYAYGAQWSHDGLTWQDLDVPGLPDSTDAAVGEDGLVHLLGKTYTVGIDDHGWPQLIGDDRPMLVVADEGGHISSGGLAYLRTGIWPWSPKDHLHFMVGWRPPEGNVAYLQARDGRWIRPLEEVTITGPAGVVTLLSVPAGQVVSTVGYGFGDVEGRNVQPAP